MEHVQVDQPRPEVQASTPAAADRKLTRTTRALLMGAVAVRAVALGAVAVGATAVGALAIGRLAVGSFVIGRGRLRSLAVDTLQVRRLHIGELMIDSGFPRRFRAGVLPLPKHPDGRHRGHGSPSAA